MPEILFMPIEEADRRAKNTAQQLWRFLAEFNARHPDPEAETVSSSFDFFTQNYVVRACAAVVAEKYVVTSLESALQTSALFHKKGTRRAIKFTAGSDIIQFTEDKPALLSHS